MPRTMRSVDSAKQLSAATGVKAARIAEAGIDSRRKGRVSAATRARQARRDDKQAAAHSLAAAPGTRARARPPGSLAPPEGAREESAAAAPQRSANAAPLKSTAPMPRSASARKTRATTITVRTARSVAGSAALDARVKKVVGRALARFAGRLTRIVVYLRDDNAEKSGSADKRCQIEARPAAQQPVSAAAASETLEKALALAAGKMKRLLASRLGRRRRA